MPPKKTPVSRSLLLYVMFGKACWSRLSYVRVLDASSQEYDDALELGAPFQTFDTFDIDYKVAVKDLY